jgi:dihydrofolate reductase
MSGVRDFLPDLSIGPGAPRARRRRPPPATRGGLAVVAVRWQLPVVSLSRVRRMSTQYYTASSLDGFIATSDHSLDWLFPLGDIADTSYPTFIRDVGAIAMGASTYEWLVRHLVQPAQGEPQPWPYTQPAWVFTSRALPAVAGADLTFVRGDVRPVHDAMLRAAGGRNVWLMGGGDLVGQFHDHGLLDEIFVQVGSVTLGSGKPLLPRAITRPSLQLQSVRMVGPGFAELHYRVARGAAT